MNGRFHRGRADPNSLAPNQGGEKAEHVAAVSPQRHDAARARVPHWHCLAEQGAAAHLMGQRLLEKRNDIGIEPARDPELGLVDADCAVFAGVVDLQDPRDR